MKAKELSLLIVDDDQIKRQLLASLVSDRYRSVTVTALQDAGSLMALKSFDVMVQHIFLYEGTTISDVTFRKDFKNADGYRSD